MDPNNKPLLRVLLLALLARKPKLRNDLRLNDNPTLTAAVSFCLPILPVFISDVWLRRTNWFFVEARNSVQANSTTIGSVFYIIPLIPFRKDDIRLFQIKLPRGAPPLDPEQGTFFPFFQFISNCLRNVSATNLFCMIVIRIGFPQTTKANLSAYT